MGKKTFNLCLAISFGGTKITIAFVNKKEKSIIAKSRRIEWKMHPYLEDNVSLDRLIYLVVKTMKELASSHHLFVQQISKIGIAWPGPGQYKKGLLTATFIPDCNEYKNIHQFILDEITKQCTLDTDNIKVSSGLDVNVRAHGEIAKREEAFLISKDNGSIINIATGIAGAIIHDGTVLREFKDLGQNYGQWGRFLFKDKTLGEWNWRSTKDGSIAPYDSNNEIRFTELCGGPAICKRFISKYKKNNSQFDMLQDLKALLDKYIKIESERNIELEKKILQKITHEAYNGSDLIAHFVNEIGYDIAEALLCLKSAIGVKWFGNKIVLTGGIGEFFGKPEDNESKDLLLDQIRINLCDNDLEIRRSYIGLDAELIGCAFL